MTKIVYVTGCLGFIGFHVAKKCLEKGFYVLGVDSMTYASNVNLLSKLENHPKFKFIHSDINELERLHDCDYVINTAAETHVDNSIVNNDVFLRSNINGVHNLLKLVKEKNIYKMPTMIHFSTDEVYGDIVEGSHKETDLLKPSNPYSATKAAADMLILAWARTYDIPYIILRPTNNYGIGQYVEKLIPKSIKYLSVGRKIQLHENGSPKRNWLHVSDTAEAVLCVIMNECKNEIFNISGNCELPNIEVVKKILKYYNNSDNVNEYIEQYVRRGHDVRYSIDDSKIKSLGWKPVSKFDEELKEIVNYYKNNFVW